MIFARRVRDLTLIAPAQADRAPFVAAASGLVVHQNCLFVVPDDELHLGVFELGTSRPGQLLRLIEGELPLEPKPRKKVKPDYEALVVLPGPSLLAVPSGSTPTRRRGMRLTLPISATEIPRPVDFSPLYRELGREFPKLNLEGAVVSGSELCLFQRGNGAGRINAVVRLALPAVMEDVARGELSARGVRAITRYELGELRGVPLTFTDATAGEDDSMWFLAVAEATEDAYEDGPHEGSVLGRIDRDGHVVAIHEISPKIKAEGIAILPETGSFLFVTDDDDPGRPSGLYVARL